jgi:predicted alpha/beta hydrolase
MNWFTNDVRIFEILATIWMWAAVVYSSFRGGVKLRRVDAAILCALVVVCLFTVVGQVLSWWPRDVQRLTTGIMMSFTGFAVFRDWKRRVSSALKR